jgi:hypothetical protein
MPCVCGQDSPRQSVYTPNVIMAGRSLPRRDDTETVQDECRKELAKKNWTGERAIEELRTKKFTDETGQLRIDTRKMPTST